MKSTPEKLPMEQSRLMRMVQETMSRHRMVVAGETVLVACSGGPDSVALLHAMKLCAGPGKFTLAALHVNHQLRGKASEQDAQFVKGLAKSLGVPFHLVKVDVFKQMAAKKQSLEEAARDVRMDAIQKIADQIGAQKAATGHTLDDQSETVLMRLFRGAGVAGLRGILPVRDGFLIRPLLEVTRREILAFCKAYDLPYREDETNQDPIYLRNRVRHELMPVLAKEYQPRIVEALGRAAALWREDEEFLEALAKQYGSDLVARTATACSLDIAGLASLPRPLASRVLRQALKEVKGDLSGISYQHLRDLSQVLANRTGASVSLPGGITARREYSRLILSKNPHNQPPSGPPVTLAMPGFTVMDEWGITVKARILKPPLRPAEPDPYQGYFDADKVGKTLTLRARGNGDRFSPRSGSGSKKLKEFLIDLKIPKEMRDQIPVIATGDDILWVVGYRLGDKGKVTNSTKRVLHLAVEDLQ